jgi:large subunit ribosomal protein L22
MADDEKDIENEDVEVEATPEAEAPPEPKAKKKTTAKASDAPTAPTNADGVVEVRASARFVRRAPRKARLVMDHIRGKSVADARALLLHTPRAAAVDIAKLLNSAVANAENNFELDPDDLRIHRATVDEGPTIKRFRPRALGRATPIHKRTSHMTITLTTTAVADKPKARK